MSVDAWLAVYDLVTLEISGLTAEMSLPRSGTGPINRACSSSKFGPPGRLCAGIKGGCTHWKALKHGPTGGLFLIKSSFHGSRYTHPAFDDFQSDIRSILPWALPNKTIDGFDINSRAHFRSLLVYNRSENQLDTHRNSK